MRKAEAHIDYSKAEETCDIRESKKTLEAFVTILVHSCCPQWQELEAHRWFQVQAGIGWADDASLGFRDARYGQACNLIFVVA